MTSAQMIILGGQIYLSLGGLLAISLVTLGLSRVAPAAAEGSWGFRLLILPAATLLWPLVLTLLLTRPKASDEAKPSNLPPPSSPHDLSDES